jgi:integrase
MSCELSALRTFFWDCQEWGWISRKFDPSRSLALPRNIKALIGRNPRVIADDIWARLLWAGLNLEEADLPRAGRDGVQGHAYPLQYVRAVALVWLFAGLRSDEVSRLRVGCVRWQQPTGDSASPPICLLDIPVNKTGADFTKPVEPQVGQAIEAWEAVRPTQPPYTDRKTSERVDVLFMYRARPMRRAVLNESVIPMLCRKAGVPTHDVRGAITSHRARATIASQLFNSREPMSLFELQAWLGHGSPASTQHYVAITPTKLAKAYSDAGYFERNVRAIQVLIDQDSMKQSAAEGEPWRYYDLGHGLCAYEFFDQCAHRMACARCDFYRPRPSSVVQLIEAKKNILRFLQEIPLTDEERAVVDGDLRAVDRLTAKLAEQPTPSGQTPEEIRRCPGSPGCQKVLTADST